MNNEPRQIKRKITAVFFGECSNDMFIANATIHGSRAMIRKKYLAI
jgi:hypothetical protein